MPLNPPPLIEAGLCLIVQPLKRSDQSRTAELTMALVSGATPSAANAQIVVDAFQTHFNSRFPVHIDSEVSIEPPLIRMGDGSAIPFEAVASAAATPGTNATSYPPPQVALLVKKTTGLGGKQNRGRSFFPFTAHSAAVSENGTVDPTFLGVFNAAAAAFLNDLGADVIPMVIANKSFNTPLPPHFVTDINAGAAVTGFAAESLVATQRRRLGR